METRQVDVLILGGGVAGMTAAVYAARAGLRVTLLEENACGGLVNWTRVVENMPSYISIPGMELADRMAEQVAALGVDVEEAACIEEISLAAGDKTVVADDVRYEARAVIAATGRRPVLLDCAGDCCQVHYCAICDGSAYKGRHVLVVGGGNSGFDEALALLDTGVARVTLIEAQDRFFAAAAAQRALAAREGAVMYTSTRVTQLHGTDALESVTLTRADGSEQQLPCDGIFVFMGQEPSTQLFRGQLELDAQGYIVTDGLMATSVPGVFAAGDVRPKRYRQITTALSDGTVAAMEAERYIRRTAG